MSVKKELKTLLENSDIDVNKINIPISVASVGDSDYIYCSNGCIYLDDDKNQCMLFNHKLEKEGMFKRSRLCINSDL